MREARTDRRPPAWKERNVYDRMLELDLAGWTWEALRCRPDDAGRILPLVGTRLMRRSDPTGDRDPGQRRTGDLRAGDFRGRRSPASVFWRADFDPAVLTVRAAPVAAADGDAFRLDRLPCRATVRRLGGGREQIIIGEGVRSIRIEVREGSVLSGPTGLRPRGVRGPRYRTACARSVRSPPPGRPFVAHALPGGTTGAPLGDGPSGLGRSAKRRRASARSSLPCSVLIALRQTGRWTTT